MADTLSRRQVLAAPALWASASAAPSERLRIGFIGCGSRGSGEMRLVAQHPEAQIVAVSDVIEPRMAQAQTILSRVGNGQKPDAALDYRRILDRKDIDAVFIATCQHQHAAPFIHACQAGKHIYVEKPLSYTIAEGQAMLKAAHKAGVKVLMGTQQRAGANYKKAVEIVRSGRLGKIGLVETWNYWDRGERVGRAKDSDPPAGYHWDQWLGPAPYVPFNPTRLQHNWWFDYSGGILSNWGPHHFDIVLWAMRENWPTAVFATGGKFVLDDQADTYDLYDGVWEFPGWHMTYRAKCFSNFHYIQSRPRSHGVAFYGKQGTLIVDRYGYELYSNTSSKPFKFYEFPVEPPVEAMEGFPYQMGKLPNGEPDGQDGPYQRGFVDMVKHGAPSPVSLEDSYRTTVWVWLGVIAYKTRRRIQWDAAKETIVGDAVAAKMMDYQRRKGYELPAV